MHNTMHGYMLILTYIISISSYPGRTWIWTCEVMRPRLGLGLGLSGLDYKSAV